MPRALILLLAVAATVPVAARTAPADSVTVVRGDTLFVVAPIEVLGSRVAAALPGALRPVGVQDRHDLALRPLRSPADALAAEPAVVTGQRQAFGVQADVSLRGSTFEQVQVLLDGFDLSDPQTGHHLMDLPLALHDIARLEVMPGHGSGLYGSGAFGGTINVVPLRPARGPGGTVGALGGPDGTWAVRGSVDIPLDGGLEPGLDPRAVIGEDGRGLRLSAERFRTDGHDVDGTWSGRDADITTATARLLDAKGGRLTDLFVGFADRRFGAQDFYTPTLGRESTETLVATFRHRRQVGSLALEPRLAARRHRDVFTLYRDRPTVYENDHLTRRALGGIRSAVPVSADWTAALDLEGAYEDIDSDGVRGGAPTEALGEHVRRRGSLAVELARLPAPVRLQFGGRLDLRSAYRPRLSGSAAAAWEPRPTWSVHASLGSVFRVPTFTELFYVDPYNRGNPDLAPESGWAWDAGVRRDDGAWLTAVTVFERHERDLIDWSRAAGTDDVWQVGNAADGVARGFEMRAAWRHGRGHRLEAGYQYVDRDTDFGPGSEAKYDLVVPRHSLTGAATAVIARGLRATVTGRWLERSGGPAGFREFAVWSVRLEARRGDWLATLDGANLLDRRYEEVPGAVMPGRTVLGGVTREF